MSMSDRLARLEKLQETKTIYNEKLSAATIYLTHDEELEEVSASTDANRRFSQDVVKKVLKKDMLVTYEQLEYAKNEVALH